LPDPRFLAALGDYRRRFRVAGLAAAVLLASAIAGLVLAAAALAAAPTITGQALAAASFLITFVALGFWSWRRWTSVRVAHAIELRDRTLENLVVTAEEIASGRARAPHPVVRDELFTAALTRLEHAPAASIQPLRRPIGVAALSIIAVVALFVAFPASRTLQTPSDRNAITSTPVRSLTPGTLRVIVTPPAYTERSATEQLNPTSVVALEGSHIRLEVSRAPGAVFLQDVTAAATRFTTTADVAFVEFVAAASRPLIVRQVGQTGESSNRLIHLRVQRDERPVAAIQQPAKDLIFADGRGQVPVEIAARDDIALTSLALRYTRVSGSGETFTFEEGEWPIEITRDAANQWRARGVLTLETLKLEDGDTLVYRAVARDARPGADPSASDTFLIEIGRVAGVASTGFALPEERDRQAISQQMLIIKTERLHADRAKLDPSAFAEQARMLAIEQRMVKAEFVFMTGGEVADEVEEAAHAHELAEGRFENSGQVELLAAIREMSRAEARLNAADTTTALEFERAALKALQRAFDRRRYLLRTLPERARIDTSRRLTGELATARSSAQQPAPTAADRFVQSSRAILQDLSAAGVDVVNPTALASRLIALDPASEELQSVALRLSAAGDDSTRAAAVREAERVVLAGLERRMAAQTRTDLTRDPLQGRLVQELPPRGTPR
jgi:hypothetical protein